MCKAKPKYRIWKGWLDFYLFIYFHIAEYGVPVQIVHFRLFLYLNTRKYF